MHISGHGQCADRQVHTRGDVDDRRGHDPAYFGVRKQNGQSAIVMPTLTHKPGPADPLWRQMRDKTRNVARRARGKSARRGTAQRWGVRQDGIIPESNTHFLTGLGRQSACVPAW